MSIRNLDHLFRPRSIALIGADRTAGSAGAVVARNLFHSGFQGPVLPVHPELEAIEGVLAYKSVAELPLTPDLAVIASPAEEVPGLIAEFGARGTKAAVVVSPATLDGNGENAARRRQAMLDAARPSGLRVIGPDSLGVMVAAIGLNAGYSPLAPLDGRLGLVAQSDTLVTAVLDWARSAGIGFSHVAALGDMSDVDFGDMLDYLAIDPHTRAILLQIESINEVRKFMSAARGAARVKPVIVIKGGRHALDAGSGQTVGDGLASADEIYDAAFARAGVLRVRSLSEMGGAAATLFSHQPVKGDRLAIVTNGGWLGLIAADALLDEGGRLADPSPETAAALDAALPAGARRANPVDLLDDAPAERYAAVVGALAKDRGVDAILVLNAPSAVASSSEAARAVTQTLSQHRKTALAVWLGGSTAEEAHRVFAENRIATYRTPEEAVGACMHLVRYRRHQDMLTEIPASVPGHFSPDSTAGGTVVEAALAAGRSRLNETESMALLSAYGIPIVQAEVVGAAEAAGAAAERIGGAVALKIHSPDIRNRAGAGGLALNLQGAAEVEAAAKAMLAGVGRAAPEAQLEGFVVQAMQRRPGAQELLLGMIEDPLFGPAIVFGQGGAAVDVLGDTAVALPPLNMNLAKQLMAETRIHRLLEGYGGQPPAAIDEIAAALINLAQLVTDRPEISAVEINPLLADAEGVLALRARVKLRRVAAVEREHPGRRLAIKPYPKRLEQSVSLRDGRELLLRPIRPEDAPALKETYARLTPEDRRMRFLGSAAELTDSLAKWMTQIDYMREMALVAVDPKSETPEILGVVRVVADADLRAAEYAVTVRSDLQGQGLGRILMERILDFARAQGVGEVWGDVLAENRGMLGLVKKLGFTVKPEVGNPGVMDVRITLNQRTD